jgi:cystathionine beta-lyase/cystathionine gamma-synthase
MVTLREGLSNVTTFASDAYNRLSSNPTATVIGGAALGTAIIGAGAVAIASRKKTLRKSSTKKRSTARKTVKRKSRKAKQYKYARTAGKRRDTSTRRIRMTKNGQPYVILASGKARFIKKSSARASRKRKGGRY